MDFTSVLNCASEECVKRKRVFTATDDDDNDGRFLSGAIRSYDTAEEENYEEIDDN